MQHESFEQLLNRSSLGRPGVQYLAARTPKTVVQDIQERVRAGNFHSKRDLFPRSTPTGIAVDPTKGGDDDMSDDEKKHQVPQVPAPGGGTQDRSRREDGRWREKRDDAGTHRPKGK